MRVVPSEVLGQKEKAGAVALFSSVFHPKNETANMDGILMSYADHERSGGARAHRKIATKLAEKEYLTTKEVATLTGFSTSYFEKGRINNYGPKCLRVGGAGRTGKVLYRRSSVEAWLASMEYDPEAPSNA